MTTSANTSKNIEVARIRSAIILDSDDWNRSMNMNGKNTASYTCPIELRVNISIVEK
jgi:hypothetical protein